MLTVWNDGPMADGTSCENHPLSMAGRANGPIWRDRMANVHFDETYLLISTKLIRRGADFFLNYETGYDCNRLAYIQELVATINAAAAMMRAPSCSRRFGRLSWLWPILQGRGAAAASSWTTA